MSEMKPRAELREPSGTAFLHRQAQTCRSPIPETTTAWSQKPAPRSWRLNISARTTSRRTTIPQVSVEQCLHEGAVVSNTLPDWQKVMGNESFPLDGQSRCQFYRFDCNLKETREDALRATDSALIYEFEQ